MSIGGHQPRKNKTVVWLTPPEILKALGPFDLDPCAAPPPRPWLTATHHFDSFNYDGLQEPWFGRVWLNPPYDDKVTKFWMKKMSTHASGIALLFARTDVAFWHDWIWPVADSVLFLKGRLYFYRPDGIQATKNSGGPSVLISYSRFDTYILRTCGLRGSLQRRA